MNNPTRLNAETTGMSVMVNEIKKPVLLTLVLLIICGLAYPFCDGAQPGHLSGKGQRQPY